MVHISHETSLMESCNIYSLLCASVREEVAMETGQSFQRDAANCWQMLYGTVALWLILLSWMQNCYDDTNSGAAIVL